MTATAAIKDYTHTVAAIETWENRWRSQSLYSERLASHVAPTSDM